MSNEIAIPVEVKNEVAVADGLARRFTAITIQNQDQYDQAAIDLKSLKTRARELDERRKSLTIPLDNAKKGIMDFFKGPIDALKSAAEHIEGAILKYQHQQEAKRIAEENRLRELQRQQEEKLRLEAEAKQKEAEKLARQAEAELAKGNQAKAEALAAKAEAASDIAEASEQTAGVLASSMPTVDSMVKKMAGVATRKVFSFEIIDANQIPREYLKPDETKIGQVVRVTKGTLQIPGVKIICRETVAA